MSDGNLFADIPARSVDEQFTTLLQSSHVRIERIVSHGHASPLGFWYDQDQPEWVMVLSGSASLEIEGESAPRQLVPGDFVNLPAHLRHRVASTDTQTPTVWLAVHYR